MFGFEKFLKKQKEPVTEPILNKTETRKFVHLQQVLEDGRIYSTENAEKITEFEGRVYFKTAKSNFFSAEIWNYCKQFNNKESEIIVYTPVTKYMNLRLESKSSVKIILGKENVELYKKYFGEPEEA